MNWVKSLSDVNGPVFFETSNNAMNLMCKVGLKVSKSQKHFFLKLHCPILNKNLLYEARAEFCLLFGSFFGQWSSRKIAFEIY